MRPWLRKHFPFIDKNVDRIGYWAGFGALVWTVTSTIVGSISSISQYGWGAVVLAGLGVACIFVLVISVCLVAWRYFNPLPPLKPSAEPMPANVATRSSSETERDILILMHFAVYQSTVLMLDDLLKSAPEGVIEGPLQLGGDFVFKNAAAHQFIDLVRRKLDPGSWRRSDFENAMKMAEGDAERQLEQTPVDQRPDNIDHLALRRWAIVHLQCTRGIDFLQKQKLETEENLRNQRFNLLERYRVRNPS